MKGLNIVERAETESFFKQDFGSDAINQAMQEVFKARALLAKKQSLSANKKRLHRFLNRL